MAKADIWMPLYVADYLADTSRLTTEQHGAYLLILMDYWRNGAPSDDDQELAQISKLSIDAWSIVRAKLERLFDVRDGHWYHCRVEEELAKASSNKSIAKSRGIKGAAARWGAKNDEQSNATSIDKAMLKQCLDGGPSPSPSPSPSSTKKSYGSRLSKDWVLPKSWGEWALLERTDWKTDDVRKCAERFKDFWIAKSGKDATKLDWEATWRNWVRNENSQQKAKSGGLKTENFTERNYGEGIQTL